MGRLTSLPSAVITDDSALGGAVIENSLRVNLTDSSYLIRTPSSAGNRRTFTISLWVKRSSKSGSAMFGAWISDQDRATLRFNTDFIEFQSTSESVKTSKPFADTNAWYHIVAAIDTTQGTQSNRGKIYVNGVQQSLSSNNLTQNVQTSVNNNSVQTFGTRWISGYNGGFDGYLAEINLIDGLQLDPTYFGYTEFQTGIWRPKAYVGSYGTNGVRLDFSDNSATTAITLGKDRSGQGNDYTPTNLSVSAGVGDDSFPESPTAKKEFPTFNSNLQTSSSTEYRQGNLAFYTSGSSTVQTRDNMSRNSGKWYAEFTLTTFTIRSGSYPYIGVAQAENFTNTWTGSSGTAYNSNGHIYRNGSQLETGHATYAQGDVISVAINLDSSPPQVWWAKNGSYIRSGANPSTLTAGVNIEPASASGFYTFTASLYANPGQWDVNFGQRPFAQSVPTGFKSLNTDNIPINTPSVIRPQKHFDTLLYTGDGSSNNRVTGLQFKPDLVWIKSRTTTDNHILQDTVRGNFILYTNLTNGDGATGGGWVKSFNHDGFTTDVNGPINTNGHNYAAWCWKAGGPAVSNSDGSITSSVSANQEAGFSIVSYTGTGSVATIGHGLGKKPDWIMVKNRTDSNNWNIYHSANGANYVLYFTSGARVDQTSNWNDTEPTSTVFTVGTSNGTNGSSDNMIAYCWTEIPGYSKFGKYTGLGVADGAYVECGFRPALVIYKRIENADDWGMHDVKRDPVNNPVYRFLYPSLNNAEWSAGTQDYFHFYSNGFKLTQNASMTNASNETYAFIAFAEQSGVSPYHTDTNAR